MLSLYFCYGLVGCFFFGYARSRERNGVFAGAFFEAFGKAVCVNIAFVLYFYYLMFLEPDSKDNYRASRLTAIWMQANVTKAARVPVRFS